MRPELFGWTKGDDWRFYFKSSAPPRRFVSKPVVDSQTKPEAGVPFQL
ncbi:MAG: hypothetical protein WAQ99_08975 [Pyrinomonadaceae bacterium]